MAKPEIQKKDLEKVLGDKFSATAVERVRFTQAVATWDITDSGNTTVRDLITIRPPSCSATTLLDVSGVSVTGTDGTTQFRLTEFMCRTDLNFDQPINVVATPMSSTPCFLTLSHVLVNVEDDVEIQAWSWDSDGNPAPGVWFDWRCRAPVRVGDVIL